MILMVRLAWLRQVSQLMRLLRRLATFRRILVRVLVRVSGAAMMGAATTVVTGTIVGVGIVTTATAVAGMIVEAARPACRVGLLRG